MPLPTRTLLQNYYGVVGPAPNDYPKVAGRVSPEDYAFLHSLLPNLQRKFDVIISTLYARYIDTLRSSLTDTSAILDVDDPRYATVFACLFDELPRCTTRRDFLLAQQEKAGGHDAGRTGSLREASLVLAGLCSDPDEGSGRGSGDSTESEGERLGGEGRRVDEGVVVDLDSSTNDILALLRR